MTDEPDLPDLFAPPPGVDPYDIRYAHSMPPSFAPIRTTTAIAANEPTAPPPVEEEPW